jgi:hypothetical protein
MFAHKFSEKRNILCGLCKKTKKCHVNSYVRHQNLSFNMEHNRYSFYLKTCVPTKNVRTYIRIFFLKFSGDFVLPSMHIYFTCVDRYPSSLAKRGYSPVYSYMNIIRSMHSSI